MKNILLIPILLILISCEHEYITESEIIANSQRETIRSYFTDSFPGYQVDTTNNGSFYITFEGGVGPGTPVFGSIIKWRYRITHLDDKLISKIDSITEDEIAPVSSTKYTPNRGFNEVIMNFKRGGKGLMLLPSRNAYGPSKTVYRDHYQTDYEISESDTMDTIPANSIIKIKFELISYESPK